MPKIYCDLDGTLIQGDLEKEFINFLRRNHKLSIKQYFMAIISVPVNTVLRKRNKGSLYKSWTYGFSLKIQLELFAEFLGTLSGKLDVRQEVLSFLKSKKDENSIILLTGSYQKLVEAFLENRGICDLFDEIIGCETQENGFRILTHPYGLDKCKFIEKDAFVIGIANEYADRFYLSMCDEAYIVGEDPELIKVANKRGWRHI